MPKHICPVPTCTSKTGRGHIKVKTIGNVDCCEYKLVSKGQEAERAAITLPGQKRKGRKYRKFAKIKQPGAFCIELTCTNPRCGFGRRLFGLSRNDVMRALPGKLRDEGRKIAGKP